MKRRDITFWTFAVIQAITLYIFGIVALYPSTTTLNPLTNSQLFLSLLIISTIGIEYLIYSNK